MTPELWTEAEAAKALHVSPRTLRGLRASGKIRYVRPSPRKVFYTPEDCADYLRAQARIDAPAENAHNVRAAKPAKSGKVVPFSQRKAAR